MEYCHRGDLQRLIDVCAAALSSRFVHELAGTERERQVPGGVLCLAVLPPHRLGPAMSVFPILQLIPF